MNLRVLAYFQIVAEELHFGRAARRLHMTQPPLSIAIRKLETELGTSLFARTRRKVELTEAGQALLEESRTIFNGVEAAENRVRRIGCGEEGRLAVGYTSMAINTALPRGIRSFIDQYPRIELALTQMRTIHQLEAIRSGQLSVGLARPFEHDLSGIRSELFHRDRYVLVVPEGHRLETKDVVSLPMLDNEPLIMFSRGDQEPLYRRFLECLESAGLSPDIVQEAPTAMAAIALAAAGIGVSFVPESWADGQRQDVSFRPLDADLPPVEISILWRAGAESPVLSSFLGILTRFRLT